MEGLGSVVTLSDSRIAGKIIRINILFIIVFELNNLIFYFFISFIYNNINAINFVNYLYSKLSYLYLSTFELFKTIDFFHGASHHDKN